jgi:hypothetical protein
MELSLLERNLQGKTRIKDELAQSGGTTEQQYGKQISS